MEAGKDKTEIRKDQIKSAAIRCFSQYGYNKTTMDDIANAIGMKKASLYYYYKNKETIICETIESEVKGFFEKANNKLKRIKSATNRLYTLVKLESEYFQEKISTFELSVSTIIEAQPLINDTLEKVRSKDLDLLTGIIQQGIDDGEFRKCNVIKVADTIRTVLDSIKFRACNQVKIPAISELNYEQINKAGLDVIDLIINGLRK